MIEFLFGHINSTSRAPMSALVGEIAGLANGTHRLVVTAVADVIYFVPLVGLLAPIAD
jgi:hypothetical protein